MHSWLDNTSTDTEKHFDTVTSLKELTSTGNTFTHVDIYTKDQYGHLEGEGAEIFR